MSSIERTVYEVKNVLLRGVFSNNTKWQILAKKYAREVANINKKYINCLDFIRNGKIIEAISLAEEGDNSLIEELEIINFPEQNQWYRICSERNWDIPVQIDFTSLELLINSYNSSILTDLFSQQYRKLAIKNGSVKRRITLLRHLLNINKNDTNYRKDLASLEKVYIAELTQQAKKSIISKDFIAMNDIFKKLTDNRLITVVDQRVTAKLNRELKKLHAVKIQKQLETLVQLISDAYSTFDIQIIGNYFNEWDILKNNEHAILEENWLLRVEEARNWYQGELDNIAENEKQKQILNKLAIALKENEKFSELETHYLYLKSVNYSIPKNVEQMYNNARDEYFANVRLKRLRKVSLSLIILIASSVAMYYLIQQIHNKLAIKNEVKQINQILAENPQKAYNYITKEEKTNELYKRNAIKKAMNNVFSVIKKEEDRVKLLVKLQDDLSLKLKKFHANGLEEAWNVTTIIKKMAEISKTPEEKALLKKISEDFNKEKKLLELKLIEKFNNILDNFAIVLGKITPEFNDEAQERLGEAIYLLQQAEKLMYVPEEYSSKQLKLARKRLNTVKSVVDDYANRELILQEFKTLLINNSYNLDLYLSELNRYSQKMKSVTKGVDTVLKNSQLYKNFNMFADVPQVEFSYLTDFNLSKEASLNNPWLDVITNLKSYYANVIKLKYKKVVKNIHNWQNDEIMKVYKIPFIDKNNTMIPYYSLHKPEISTVITPRHVSYTIKARLIDPSESSGVNVQFKGYNNNWVLQFMKKSNCAYQLPASARLATSNTDFKFAPYIGIWKKLSGNLSALPSIYSVPNFELYKGFSQLLENNSINPVIKLQLLETLSRNNEELMYAGDNKSIQQINKYFNKLLKEYQIPDRYIFSNMPFANTNEIAYKLKSKDFKQLYQAYSEEIINDSVKQLMSAIAINRKIKFIGCMLDSTKREKFLNLSDDKLDECKELWTIVNDPSVDVYPKIIIIAKKNKSNRFVFENTKINSLTPIFAPLDGKFTEDIEKMIVKRFKLKKLPEFEFWPKNK